MIKPKVLILNSGGADSICSATLLHQSGYDVYSLFIDYGQPNAEKEWESVQWCMSTLRDGDVDGRLYSEKLSLASSFSSDGLEAEEQEIYLRNFVFMAYATQLAYTLNIKTVALGYINFQEMVTYIDDDPKLIQSYHHLIQNHFGMRILTPVAGYEKEMIYTTLIQNGFDPQSLPYCNTPIDVPIGELSEFTKKVPCGKCHKCKYTKQTLTRIKESLGHEQS